jgi:hypothetical protein
MRGAIPPLRQYAFTAWCSVKEKHRDNFILSYISSRDSSVGIEMGYELDDRGSRVRFLAVAGKFFSSQPCPERLWGPPSLLSNGYQGPFPGGKTGGGA